MERAASSRATRRLADGVPQLPAELHAGARTGRAVGAAPDLQATGLEPLAVGPVARSDRSALLSTRPTESPDLREART